MGKSYKEQREWELKQGIKSDRLTKSKKKTLKDKFIEDTDWDYEYPEEELEEKEEKYIKPRNKENKEC